jgi:hypothetical protein
MERLEEALPALRAARGPRYCPSDASDGVSVKGWYTYIDDYVHVHVRKLALICLGIYEMQFTYSVQFYYNCIIQSTPVHYVMLLTIDR